jgi:hypothetical protein
MLAFSGTSAIKTKSINKKWPNTGLPGPSPTDSKAYSSIGDVLQHLNGCSLEGRCKDARFVVMYKIASDNVATYTGKDKLNITLETVTTHCHNPNLLKQFRSLQS